VSNHGTTHWPTEIRLHKAEKRLDVTFEDGTRFELPADRAPEPRSHLILCVNIQPKKCPSPPP